MEVLKMRKSYVLLGCLTLGMALSAAPKKVKIIAAHNQTTTDNPYQVGLLKFKEVAEKVPGIEVEVHAGTIGTNEDELIEKLKLGAADIVVVSPGFMTKTGVKEVDILALPYMFDSYEHWEKVVDGEVGKDLSKTIYDKSKKDFQILGYWSAGVRHYYGKKPVNSIEDIKGLKIRTQTSGAVGKYWSSIGSIPTNVAWGELYQGLQQGTVDSAENAYPYFIPMDHHKTSNGKYISETSHDYTTRLLIVNGKKFAKLSPEQQQAILEAGQESTKAERQAVYAEEGNYKQKAIQDGALVNTLDRTPFIEAALPIQNDTAKSIGATELLEKIRKAGK